MARIIVGFFAALLLIAHVQTGVLASDSTCYEITQVHRALGHIRICFDAKALRIDRDEAHLSLFSKAPDWRVNVFNFATKKQASTSFTEWCNTGFSTFAPWVERKDLVGHCQKKIPIVFDGFKAYQLFCSDSREVADKKKDGISWSTKTKVAALTYRYVFLDGLKMDNHVPKIMEAIYLVSWEDRLLMAINGTYDQTGEERWVLSTVSIKALPSPKVSFKQPTGFQTVPMAQVSQGKVDFFN
jgi:hypothetical protein